MSNTQQLAPLRSKEFVGSVAILVSMLCFYLEAAVVRWATTNPEVALGSAFLMFARFFLGFLVTALVFLFQRRLPQPKHTGTIIYRAVTNMLAVYCSYKAVELTTLAEGTILNMTSPVFIGIFTWILLKHQRDIMATLMTFVGFYGIFLVVAPQNMQFHWESLWGLMSGIISAISLMLLNTVRQENDTNTVLFVVFGVGMLIQAAVFYDQYYLPSPLELIYLVSGAISAIAGQYLLTMGFRYVTAVKGGILSSSRIVLSAFLGPYITSDPHLTLSGWLGALIILGTNIYFISRKTTPDESQNRKLQDKNSIEPV
ncbi:hypothetical protein U27_04607 [Candidatus Vecturithrix granuli]|uniref:EamA domain-containing protein n=1 Tax=Vecturithrix granuli TaxID=1499967 RepID=A0A081BZ85_VECG1|nr:hypothetical protein U27_04607 [Candidatus Vecturithrix granuli]